MNNEQVLNSVYQSTEVLNTFLERLRQEPSINLLNIFSFEDIAVLNLSIQRLKNFITQLHNQLQPQDDDVEEI